MKNVISLLFKANASAPDAFADGAAVAVLFA